MSTIKVNAIQHTGGANVAMTLASNGEIVFPNTTTFSGNVKAASIIHPSATNTSLSLASSGNVGIGVSSPTFPLHVKNNFAGDGAGGIMIDRPNNSSYEAPVTFATNGTKQWSLGLNNDSTETLQLYNTASSVPVWTANVDGTIKGQVANKGYTYVQLTTPKVWQATVTGASGNYVSVTSTLALPAGIKALYTNVYHHVTGYGGNGYSDHVVDMFGPTPISNQDSSWSWTTTYYTTWGSYMNMHDGDASGAPNYYGQWGDGGIIGVSSDLFYYMLAAGYSGGTHYITLFIWGYWI